MNIWKLGTKWGSNAPSFYEYIKEEGIVISYIDLAKPKKGDYMLITDGFMVLAIAILLADPQPVTTNPALESAFNPLEIDYMPEVIYAPAKYRVLLPEEQFLYENRRGIVQVKSKVAIRQTLAVMGEMLAIHQNCFSFLEQERQKNSSFYFRLRQQNNQKRLEKGYWFWGNDDYCLLTFWKGNDTLAKVPNIHFKIEITGKATLVLTSTDNEEKSSFMQKIAGMIGGMQQRKKKGEWINQWEKYYDQHQNEAEGNSYIYALKDFIDREKEIIDAFLLLEKNKPSDNLGSLGFIEPETFEKQYQIVQNYKKDFVFDPFTLPKPTEISEPLKSIRLTALLLENIGHFEKLEIDLNHRIICLLGYNGTGKTTLLRALALGLSGIDDNPEIDTSDSSVQQLLRIGNPTQNGTIEHPFAGRILLKYQLDKPYTNVVDLKKEPGMFSVGLMNDPTEQGDVFGFSDGNNQYKHLILGFAQLQGSNEAISSSTFSTFKPNIYDILPLLYNKENNRYKALGNWIMQIEADSQSNLKNERTLIDFIFQVLSQIIGEDILLDKIEHQEGHIWLSMNGRKMLYSLLSQGFKNVFAWVGHLIRRLYESSHFKLDFYNAPAIVLIDEIDTYLHPKWQSKILDILAESFPNIQFIVTTHSPLVASHVYAQGEKALVYIIKKEEQDSSDSDNFTYQYTPIEYKQTYGRDITSIFFEWMDIPERDVDVQQKIDGIFDWIDDETVESVEKAEKAIQELDLPDTEPIITKLKMTLDMTKENLLD